MRISILCSSAEHPVYPWITDWCADRQDDHEIELVHSGNDLGGGDILFLISSSEIVGADIRQKYSTSLVIHASDVPKGRGWSPHIWQILEGRNEITITLLEAADKVDSGSIWEQRIIRFEGHELFDEINNTLNKMVIELMDFAVANAGRINPRPQSSDEASYFRKRTPEDSRIDPNESIASQFDLLRVTDPDRYPAFFDFRDHRYEIRLIKSRRKQQ